ncbi:cyanelle 30S ribosomal protein S10 [Ipomoea triloba]|uniref:cyanelle 30S ribosomal protein S10 n=1 Tax=Ipomoea triloba TaxID=35885 RepID=UPI00125CF7B3|nr:cyanelle 30S ribosomal protein S10 [Ipomoea triloba]
MAISSSSLSASVFPVCNCNSSAISAKPKLSFTSLPPNCAKFHPLKTSRLSTSRILAAPEVLDSSADVTATQDEAAATSFPDVSFDSDKVAPKHKIRIKLRSYWVPLIEDSCKQIMDAARNTNAKTMGPVPLPTKKRIYCVLKSPHVDKDARFHFEIRTHQRLIDILYPTAQTIDSLMQLDLPAGVDVEVKL